MTILFAPLSIPNLHGCEWSCYFIVNNSILLSLLSKILCTFGTIIAQDVESNQYFSFLVPQAVTKRF